MAYELFPQPQEVTLAEGVYRVSPASRVVLTAEAPLLEEAAQEWARQVEKLAGFRPPLVRGEPQPGDLVLHLEPTDRPEQYHLDTRGETIEIAGEAAGVFYGVQTLKQWLHREDGQIVLPRGEIRDWPALRYRGIYLESKWGMDLMSLADWQDLIDRLTTLKFNLLGVGVYGCWCVQYNGQVTEFLTVPFVGYPELQTPKTIRYYSPAQGREVEITYLPRLFEEDFFGEVVAYGHRKNLIVRPHFNSLGHNTLIPRLYPEVSAVDKQGQPTGYGFCLSNPRTYELLFALYDQLIDRYLTPQGVDFFHLGMDEVYPIYGADPRDPRRRVSPWCQCPQCRQKSPEEHVVAHLLKICSHLAAKGIRKISTWNDQLTRHMDLLNQSLVERMREAGVADKVVLQWWHYGLQPPKTIRPELGLENWVTPMHGYFFWWPYQSYVENIFLMEGLAQAQGATGTESYGSDDPAFHRNLCALSEWSWNTPEATGGIAAFHRKYARALAPLSPEEAQAAFLALDELAAPGELQGFVRKLFPYAYTYPRPNLPYPRHYPGEVLQSLQANAEEAQQKLQTCSRQALRARMLFTALAENPAHDQERLRQYAVEARRIEAVVHVFEQLLEVLTTYRQATEAAALSPARALAPLTAAKQRLEAVQQEYEPMMAEFEAAKPAYLHPQALRELTTLRDRLQELQAAVQEQIQCVQRGELPLSVEEFFGM
ncbi:MAG TPA: hypothetical protein EYP85_10840 [Armatimonadetes bacterium]|nr:hypothetical protein [Armatimonadota bacterium]